MKALAIFAAVIVLFHSINIKAEAPMTTADMAEQCGITEAEFIFLSSVVEAESDRSESLAGRILICETIMNRVYSEQFPNTINEVLCQSGQFSTVRNGHSVTNRTEYSDQAVLLAFEELEAGEAPAVLWFNCIGFTRWGTDYALVDGNYFSC